MMHYFQERSFLNHTTNEDPHRYVGQLNDLYVFFYEQGKHSSIIYKDNHKPESRCGHPNNESSARFGQLRVRITKSELVIHGVTRSSRNFLRFGIENLKADIDISPKQ